MCAFVYLFVCLSVCLLHLFVCMFVCGLSVCPVSWRAVHVPYRQTGLNFCVVFDWFVSLYVSLYVCLYVQLEFTQTRARRSPQ